jgi:hypothetical protein
VAQVLRAASAVAPVVIDLARYPDDARAAAIERCTLVLLLCRADLAAATAARTVAGALGAAPVVALVVGRRTEATRTAELIGVTLAARLAPRRPVWRANVLEPAALPQRLRQLTRGLLAGLAPVTGGLDTQPPASGWTPAIELTG